MSKLKSINVRWSDTDWRFIKSEAQRLGIPMSSVIIAYFRSGKVKGLTSDPPIGPCAGNKF